MHAPQPFHLPTRTTAIDNNHLSVHLMSLASVFGASNMPGRTVSASGRSEASSSLSAHGRRTPFPKSDVQIHIKNHYKTKTYTSSSPVSGQVTITTQRDVPFDSIEIDLIGTSKTRTEGYSAPTESSHTFLKLVMPIPESTYPVPRVLETGRTMTIPFHFVLPNFLTLSACQHKVESEHAREQHLCLPPSMGSWARGNWEKDDLAPHMAEVVYSIKARVWREPEFRGRPIKIMEGVKSIQVLPAFAEAAPLTIASDETDTMYRMSKTKTLRKNILSSKLGTLTVSAPQPRAIALHPDGRVAAASAAQLDLQFTPLAADARPPKITGVAAKLVAHTYYSAGPFNSLPNMGDFMKGGLAARRGVYSTSVNLPSVTLDSNPVWFTHRLSRRDSGYGSDSSVDEEQSQQQLQQQQQKRQRRKSSFANLIRTTRPSSPTNNPIVSSNVVHSTSIHLPLTLPTTKKTFVPTFHSCIVSRVYTLHVALTVDSTTATKISLDLPLQITVVAGVQVEEEGEELPSWAEAVEEAAADEFLRPRVLGVMEEFGGGGDGGLPGYERHG